MNKYLLIGVAGFLVIAGGWWYLNRSASTARVPVVSQITGKTNNFENTELVRLAKEYILNKPKLSISQNTNVDWDKEPGLLNASPEWITSHKPAIDYVPVGKYQTPYDYLNDKYIVGWFFIPGCEEDPNSKNVPNWSTKNGLFCLGGYSLRVLINADGTVNLAQLNALD